MADDDSQRRFVRARELIDRGKQAFAEGHRLMRQLTEEVESARARGMIHQAIWECERLSNKRAHYFSQSGQDAFLDERVFRGKRGGVFVEVGGYDGLTGSNCLYFEMLRGWSGLVIEPSPTYHAMAAAFRRATCMNVAVAPQQGEAAFLEITDGMRQMSGLLASYPDEVREQVEAQPRHKAREITVKTRPLAQILAASHLSEIDIVSLDAIGTEAEILRGFPFDRFKVAVWIVDNQLARPEIPEILRGAGYKRVEALGPDDIYVMARQG